MIKRFFFAALAALLFPAAALAQMEPPGGPPGGPPPEFQKIRQQYGTAALNDLSADHRAKVQAIIAQVQNGSLDPRTASSQIDAILTPDESKAVLGEAQKARAAMEQAFAANGGGPPHRPNNRRTPDAGRALLMLSMPPGGMPHP